MSAFDKPLLDGWKALVLHRAAAGLETLTRQLETLGIEAKTVWPALAPTDAAANVVFFDADMGFDAQFPWPPGCAPMPLIALIGSEAPGRIEWALSQGSNAHLLKPIGSTGVYSALLIASHAHAKADGQASAIASLQTRLRQRPTVVRAVVRLMNECGEDETSALKRLRSLAMDRQITIEEAAEWFVGRGPLQLAGRNEDTQGKRRC